MQKMLSGLALVAILSCWGCVSAGSNYAYGNRTTTHGSGIFSTQAAAGQVNQTFPATNPSSVTVTEGPAPGPHTVIGQVSASFNEFSMVSRDKLSEALQIKAAELGADMVVNVRFEIVPIMNIGSAEGTAIKLNQ